MHVAFEVDSIRIVAKKGRKSEEKRKEKSRKEDDRDREKEREGGRRGKAKQNMMKAICCVELTQSL